MQRESFWSSIIDSCDSLAEDLGFECDSFVVSKTIWMLFLHSVGETFVLQEVLSCATKISRACNKKPSSPRDWPLPFLVVANFGTLRIIGKLSRNGIVRPPKKGESLVDVFFTPLVRLDVSLVILKYCLYASNKSPRSFLSHGSPSLGQM